MTSARDIHFFPYADEHKAASAWNERASIIIKHCELEESLTRAH